LSRWTGAHRGPSSGPGFFQFGDLEHFLHAALGNKYLRDLHGDAFCRFRAGEPLERRSGRTLARSAGRRAATSDHRLFKQLTVEFRLEVLHQVFPGLDTLQQVGDLAVPTA
jgi:hypothetical protein